MKKIILVMLGVLLNVTFAQISFDRTRVILDNSRGSSQTIVIDNSTEGPFLAQAWIEDATGKKITTPLAALPILQRINSGQTKQLKINVMGDTSHLQNDRETMFFLNVLGVPPKDGSVGAQVNVVVQSKMKLFYRPAGLPSYKSNGWVEDVVIKKNGNSLTLENPTAYHVIVYGFSGKGGRTIERDVILKPFSSENISVNVPNDFSMMIVGDQGAGIEVKYNCASGSCTGKMQFKK